MFELAPVGAGVAAGLLLASAAAKSADQEGVQEEMSTLIGRRVVIAVPRVLVLGEIGLAMVLMVPWGISLAVSLGTAAVVFVGFALVMLATRFTIGRTSCGCFGTLLRSTNSTTHILANLVGGLLMVALSRLAAEDPAQFGSSAVERVIGVSLSLSFVICAAMLQLRESGSTSRQS